jgi:hypothetical protein
MAVLDLGINDAILVLKKRWQVAASNVAILVDRGRKYRAAVP